LPMRNPLKSLRNFATINLFLLPNTTTMRRYNLALSFLTFLTLVLLSGCSQAEAPETTQGQETKRQAEEMSLLAEALDTTQKAKQDIQKATEQENQRLNQALSEIDTTYSQQYQGVILHTSIGDIQVTFHNEDSPLTVNNFLKLAQEKFYDGTKFHRVIKDFMIQGGDPNSKDNNWADDGVGGPGYTFKDEINNHPLIRGSVAMANAGPNTNGSQFFIVTASSTPWLDGKHTNFGEVTSGLDIVDKIENTPVNTDDHPLEDIIIQSVELVKK
jgi:cyclophilin family peptidyl-prolyl cis-trans isomerase